MIFPKLYQPEKSQPNYREDFSFSRPWPRAYFLNGRNAANGVMFQSIRRMDKTVQLRRLGSNGIKNEISPDTIKSIWEVKLDDDVVIIIMQRQFTLLPWCCGKKPHFIFAEPWKGVENYYYYCGSQEAASAPVPRAVRRLQTADTSPTVRESGRLSRTRIHRTVRSPPDSQPHAHTILSPLSSYWRLDLRGHM